MYDHQLPALAEAARRIAREAGALIRNLWREPRTILEKGFRDPVTDADFASQRFITQWIREQFPTHGFLAEETDESLPTSGPVIWLIDPVDGTTNYSRHIPGYSVSVAAAIDGQVAAGAIYDPTRDELFWALRGGGSFLGDEPLRVNMSLSLDKAILALDWSGSERLRRDTIASLVQIGHEVRTIRAIGSAALALAWLAAGRIDLYFNYSLGPWDIAAGALIVQEAGGQISSLTGKAFDLQDYSTWTLTSNGYLHPLFRHTLAGLGAGV